jgi:putative DNA primase/helicase
MESRGIEPPDQIIQDGKIHRFAMSGDRQKSGWYRLFTDYPPAGVFGHFKLYGKEKFKWSHKPDRELTPDEKEKFQKYLAAERARKYREEQRLRERTKRKAGEIWGVSHPNPTDHAYLSAKRIQPHCARVLQATISGVEKYIGHLVVPVTRDGELLGLQFIAPGKPDGDEPQKKFMFGTKPEGCYTLLGPKPAGVLVVCEGFATGASIAEATGLPVFVAYSAGNLSHVCKRLREREPDCRIIVAADDDRWTTTPVNNPGVHYAGQAAAAVAAEVCRPYFKPGFEGRPTDFNDLAVLYGQAEVAYQILNGKPSFQVEETSVAPHVPDSVILDMLPDQKPGKKPISTIRNLEAILDRVGAVVRYNVIRKSQEWSIPGEVTSMDNQMNVIFARILDLCNRFGMSTKQIKDFLLYLSDKNQYNPVTVWIESKPWDGKSRLGELFATIKAKGEDTDPKVKSLKATLIRRWLVSAVAAAFRPKGVSAHGVLVLQGDQYIGKTKWFKSLVPEELGVIAEGKSLNPADKDSVKQVISYWLVELGELDATFRKSDIAQLKAFLTRDHDMIRLPYAPAESLYARRTVFFGSVNPDQYLADTSGNRRYWTISCTEIDHSHSLDMQQVWAEVYELYKAGESWYLTIDELKLLNEHNLAFELTDPVEERIRSHYNWSITDEARGRWLTATEVIMEIEPDRAPTKIDVNRASAIVKSLNGNRTKRSDKKGSRVIWLPPTFAVSPSTLRF